MEVVPLPLQGAAEIRSQPARDERGWFARLFCQRELAELNGGRPIQQINSSFTAKRGALRGLHFQHPPHAEDKVVRCLAGRVFDVMLDMRRGSPTFARWHAVVLDAAEMNMIYIPKGFAHGFQTLEDNCQILYLHTAFHAPEAEGGVRYDSPSLGIEWPIAVTELSQRDQHLPVFDPSSGGISP
jgi:dTDP-4-dehydrorhamnose 3,5-epimerase